MPAMRVFRPKGSGHFRATRRKVSILLASLLVSAVVAIAAWQLLERAMDPLSEWRLSLQFRLPRRMRVQETVTNLSATFEQHSVVAEAADRPVRVDGLEPLFWLHMTGGHRQAIVASPPSVLRFCTLVPVGSTLRFGIGVQGDGKRDPQAAGVRFGVSLDGRGVFARDVNPAANRHDRQWFEESVDLGVETDREVEILLTTRVAGTGPRLAGTPGWSHVRIVKETWRDRQPASPAAPNVLLLLVDTLRADAVGCYGAKPTRSPNLDRLARDGLVFDQAVSQASWTLPSVATIFTGLHPRSHGVVGELEEPEGRAGEAVRADMAYLSHTIRTLAEYAQDAGITTVGVTTNPLVSQGTNLAQGFETFVQLAWDGKRSDWPRAEEVNSAFLHWLHRNKRYRFFAYLHYMELHNPYNPADSDRPPTPDGVRSLVARGKVGKITKKIKGRDFRPLTQAELEYLRGLYDYQLPYWDSQLEVLLRGLSATGVMESTVLVIMSDHGEEFLEHGHLEHSQHLYEELIRVPLIMRGPGVARGRVAEQAQGIDILPTVAQILGLKVASGLPGENLFAVRRNRAAISETGWSVGVNGTSSRVVSLRTPEWKLIHHPATDSFELYDLRRDPAERENRWGAAPEGPALERMLADWRAGAPPPPQT